jgi:hypothetical protein
MLATALSFSSPKMYDLILIKDASPSCATPVRLLLRTETLRCASAALRSIAASSLTRFFLLQLVG